jgi:hypothetical protein
MQLIPFSAINQKIRELLWHPHIYSQRTNSFLKIFQHGLYYHFTQQDKKIIFNYLLFPIWIQRTIYYLKSKSAYQQNRPVCNEIVIIDPGRVVVDGDKKHHSIYFSRIAELIDRSRLTLINQNNAALTKAEFSFADVAQNLPPLDAAETTLLKEIQCVLRSSRKAAQFDSNERKQIQSAIHIFFFEFRVYYNLLKNQATKKLLFTCHYHNEGLIAACEILGIETIELQHGLIAANDLYYVYDAHFKASINRSFFPNKILVYGPYWKKILESGCEFRKDQIHIGGDYLYRLKESSEKQLVKENLIVICAQKNMHDDYVSYAKDLIHHTAKHPEWKIVVKLHPLERNKEPYYKLVELGVEIRDIETPLDNLLKRCKIQISIYSTTFYDALGFDVCNYSLQQYGSMSDYAAEMIEEGVAEALFVHENPIEKFISTFNPKANLSRDEVYAQYDTALIRRLLS